MHANQCPPGLHGRLLAAELDLWLSDIPREALSLNVGVSQPTELTHLPVACSLCAEPLRQAPASVYSEWGYLLEMGQVCPESAQGRQESKSTGKVQVSV